MPVGKAQPLMAVTSKRTSTAMSAEDLRIDVPPVKHPPAARDARLPAPAGDGADGLRRRTCQAVLAVGARHDGVSLYAVMQLAIAAVMPW